MRIILVGGFLGAGKTTLLAAVAQRLLAQGRRVGLISNDQAPELVDTALFAGSGAAVREVAGSCFCCNFHGFAEAAQALHDEGAEVVIAEPVGSCTDLSATIAQPLKELFRAWEVAPLSVLVDPHRLQQLLRDDAPRLHPDAVYIFERQLFEADQIILTKADTLPDPERQALAEFLHERFPGKQVTAVSAHTGEGVEEWLEGVLAGERGGQHIAEIDYDRYAQGEAVLAWLNAAADLRWIGGLKPGWESFIRDLMAALQEALILENHEIGHLKMLLQSPEGRLQANLTSLHAAPTFSIQGELQRLRAHLTINTRAELTPQAMEPLFRRALQQAAHGRVAAKLQAFHCFSPGRPVPTHRYKGVVQ